MGEWFDVPGSPPAAVLVRLIAACALGAAVAWIHARTTQDAEMGQTFPATLVLLAVLIAMVTQVIGDNVARAFSLVGALSIVRFRTVVRDTRDTAFVIFAVVVGMAAGAQSAWVAIFGLIVGGMAAFALKAPPARGAAGDWVPAQTLRVRAAMAVKLESAVASLMTERAIRHRLTLFATQRQGTVLEAGWEITVAKDAEAEELTRAVGKIDGVQDVRLERRTSEEK